jgi:hypothetical protein
MPKKRVKRQVIIDAAIEVFSQNGFQNSTISEIAQRANVAEGTTSNTSRTKRIYFFSIPVEKNKGFCEQLDLQLQGLQELSRK